MNYSEMFRLPIVNDVFESVIFPSKDKVLKCEDCGDDNPIYHSKIVVYGDQRYGKTAFNRKIAELAMLKYGELNVNAIESRYIEFMLVCGLNSKPIHIMNYDDFTLHKEDDKWVKCTFKIRNILNKVYGLRNGLAISLYSTHRFHSIMPEIRSTANCVVFKSSSLNPYDLSIIKKLIGDDGLHDLSIIEHYSTIDDSILSYSVVNIRGYGVGLLKYDKPLCNRFTFVDSKNTDVELYLHILGRINNV